MRYMILDYEPNSVPVVKKHELHKIFKILEKSRIYKKYQLYQQHKQLFVKKEEFRWDERKLIYVSVLLPPKELQRFSMDEVEEVILQSITVDETRTSENKRCKQFQEYKLFKQYKKNKQYKQFRQYEQFRQEEICLLAVKKELERYVSSQFSWCADVDEVYINLLQQQIEVLCKSKNISRKSARLLFLDDGTYNIEEYMKCLTKDWNYVSVFSNRHEELEELYRYLYEEEGLMVECMGREMCHSGQGDMVIDLMGSYKGIHRIYAESAYVLDVTFSAEKEKYIRDKWGKCERYAQIINLLIANK